MKKTTANPTGVLKPTVVTAYVKKATGLRVAKDAVAKFIADFDAVIFAVVKETKRLALDERRKTITKEDVAAAIEKYLRRQDLPWDETAKEVIKHNPADLGKISKTIRDWITEHDDQADKPASRSANSIPEGGRDARPPTLTA